MKGPAKAQGSTFIESISFSGIIFILMRISPFKLERFFATYEFKASYLLCASDCESWSIQELLDFEPDSLEKFKGQWLGYMETQGTPALRNEVTNLYQSIRSDEVLIHVGAQEAIFIFMNAALQKGDHLIVHWPCYQSLFEIANSLGCAITKWEGKEEHGWELDIEFLKQHIKKNTKAIIINCPHNPTGYLMSQEKLSQIIDIARKHNIILFSDEVYRFLEYDREDLLPGACDLYKNAVSIGVMSKTFGLAGLRIGWAATKNKDIYRKMASLKDYTSICASAPSEFLATLALRHKDKVIGRNVAIILNNLEILNEFFEKWRKVFDWKQPKAGTIAFPRLKLKSGAKKFCTDLVEKKGVLLLPSNYYDYGNRHIRFGFGRKNMPECVEKLDQYLKENF